MLFLVLFCLYSSALADTLFKPIYQLEDAEKHFEDFIRLYQKQYADEAEKSMRFEIFKQFLEHVNSKNSNPDETATFGITKFADLTHEEFLQRYTGFIPAQVEDVVHVQGDISVDLPLMWDWRNKNAVTRVKDQGGCGSCWAFSVTGAVESAYAITHKNLTEFSEQQLLDCAPNHGCSGGGEMTVGLEYLMSIGGSETESAYPYTAMEGTCKFEKSQVKAVVTGVNPYMANEEQLRQLLYINGPLSISIDSSSLHAHSYGIIKNCTFEGLNHGVLLVGYGTENDVPFWIIKNSWGLNYGENGYVRVKRGVNACGMLKSPALQVIVK